MSTRLKICGITSIEDARAALEAGADALGFIFYAKSPRCVTPEQAAAVIARLPPFTVAVGLFVDERPERVREIFFQCRLSLVQLHGAESPEYCAALGLPAIKAFRVRPQTEAAELAAYRGLVRGYLLDTYRKGVPGGTGESFDWGLVEKLAVPGPVILAGGLSPENVVQAMKAVRPYALDVNSGVEAAPGRKDPQKLRQLAVALREGCETGDVRREM